MQRLLVAEAAHHAAPAQRRGVLEEALQQQRLLARVLERVEALPQRAVLVVPARVARLEPLEVALVEPVEAPVGQRPDGEREDGRLMDEALRDPLAGGEEGRRVHVEPELAELLDEGLVVVVVDPPVPLLQVGLLVGAVLGEVLDERAGDIHCAQPGTGASDGQRGDGRCGDDVDANFLPDGEIGNGVEAGVKALRGYRGRDQRKDEHGLRV